MEVHEARPLELVPADPRGVHSSSGRITFLIGQNAAEREPQVMVKPPSTASVWPVT